LAFEKIAYFRNLKGPNAQKMKATSYHVLMMLYDYSRGDGTNAHPGVERLARDCGVDQRSVNRALTELKKNKIIGVQQEGGGSGHATVYRLLIPDQSAGVDSGTLTDSAETLTAGAENPDRQCAKTLTDTPPQQTSNRPATDQEQQSPVDDEHECGKCHERFGGTPIPDGEGVQCFSCHLYGHKQVDEREDERGEAS
jgi:hypothetical protein